MLIFPLKKYNIKSKTANIPQNTFGKPWSSCFILTVPEKNFVNKSKKP